MQENKETGSDGFRFSAPPQKDADLLQLEISQTVLVIKKVFMDGSARFLSFDQIEMAMLTSDGKIGNNSSQFYL